MFWVLGIVYLFGGSGAVIYKLEDTDYARMPPVMHLDPYESCFVDPDGLYCAVEVTLVSDEPSPLLSMIQEYSAHTTTHFNHTLLNRGICVTQKCKQFYENSNGDLKLTLEACFNETFYEDYKLKTRVSDGYDCSKRDRTVVTGDIHLYVAAICAIILCANILGSFCHFLFEKSEKNPVLRYVCCFSLRRNWKKLTNSTSEGRDSRLLRLQCIHGIRVLTMCLVIAGHTLLALILLPENTDYVEELYLIGPCHIILNGTGIMQTFLLISAFLLVYMSLLNAEKQPLSWTMLPKYIIMRWLRLTPAYALVLALTATWFGRLTTGPLYTKLIAVEVSDCRSKWWQNLLYVNNYVDDSECMVQSWYLAADMQLYCVAAIAFLACRTPRSRKLFLTLMFVVGMVIPTAHTYFHGLQGVLVVSPTAVLSMFIGDATFNQLYKRGHTNLTGCAIGIAMGYLIYHWQKKGVSRENLQSYRFWYWMLFPLGCLCCYSGGLYYAEAPPPPTHVNLLFAALHKPLFGATIAAIITGIIFEIEDVYRPILEWGGWTVPSRLSYSTYLIHVAFIRNYGCLQTTMKLSFLVLAKIVVTILIASYILGFILFMLVEAPFANLVKECLQKPVASDAKDVKEKVKVPIESSNNKVAKEENFKQD